MLFGISVLYLLLLQFFMFQNYKTIMGIIYWIDPKLQEFHINMEKVSWEINLAFIEPISNRHTLVLIRNHLKSENKLSFTVENTSIKNSRIFLVCYVVMQYYDHGKKNPPKIGISQTFLVLNHLFVETVSMNEWDKGNFHDVKLLPTRQQSEPRIQSYLSNSLPLMTFTYFARIYIFKSFFMLTQLPAS